MAKSINQVNIMGRLTRDPEMRSTTTGKTISSFSIAVDRGGQDDQTDFFDVTAWNKLAEIVDQYTSKGSKVYVSGRLQLDQWEADGQKRSKVSIVANDVVFLDSKGDNQGSSQPSQAQQEDKSIDLSEIPF